MIKTYTACMITVICLFIFARPAFAQEPETAQESIDSPGNGATIYAYGGIGPAIPLGKFGKERSAGFDLNTAIEYRLSSGLLLRGMFDFSSFSFEAVLFHNSRTVRTMKLAAATTWYLC